MQIKKHTLNLREGDYEYLQKLGARQQILAASIIRALVSQYVDRARKAEEQTND